VEVPTDFSRIPVRPSAFAERRSSIGNLNATS
jgi:hypothetical protein